MLSKDSDVEDHKVDKLDVTNTSCAACVLELTYQKLNKKE